jgi:ATP:ADP antiporter, AAA family
VSWPGEPTRFATLASLLFIPSLVIELNEVVAISGFVSSIGVMHIPWLWAADALLVICFSSGYALVVDQMKHGWRPAGLLFGFSVAYALLSLLFALNKSAWLRYQLLLAMNNQQWRLVPLLI